MGFGYYASSAKSTQTQKVPITPDWKEGVWTTPRHSPNSRHIPICMQRPSWTLPTLLDDVLSVPATATAGSEQAELP